MKELNNYHPLKKIAEVVFHFYFIVFLFVNVSYFFNSTNENQLEVIVAGIVAIIYFSTILYYNIEKYYFHMKMDLAKVVYYILGGILLMFLQIIIVVYFKYGGGGGFG